MAKRLIRLFVGLILFSLGNAFIYYGNIGLDSWNSFHDGISQLTYIPIGFVSIIVSVVVLIFAVSLGEKVGIGTIADSIIVGLFFQIFIDMGFLSIQSQYIPGLIYNLIGMEIISLGVILYVGAGLGMGPRDSMYLGLAKKLNTKMGYTKAVCEVLVVIIAFFIGGRVGIGTFINAFCTGLILQLNINLFKFDPKEIKQENVLESLKRAK